MARFAYKARRPGYEASTDVIEAADLPEAVARLKRLGLFILSVEPADRESERGSEGGGLFRRISRQDVAVLTSQLASLLKAGLPLVSALRSLEQQMEGAPLAAVIAKVQRSVAEAHTFSESLGRFPRVFPRAYTAAVRAGEEGGMLAEVLARLAGNLKKEIEVRGRVRTAMAYPIFLCILGALTLVVLLTFVIPKFTSLFATMGENLPLPTRVLLAFSGTMDRFWPVLLGGLTGLALLCVFAARQQAVREAWDRLLLRAPYVGSIVRRSEISRFARTLSELLTNGVPILTGLQITRGVMSNGQFASALDAIRAGVAKGSPLAEVMRDLGVFTPLVINMVAVGEQSGQLTDLLLEVADIYEKECERAIQAFTTILGPALIVVLGGVIAFVITAILLPVFQAGTLVS